MDVAADRYGGDVTGSGAVTQRRIVLWLAIVIGLTRFLAIARTMFDWDEGLFALGVRDYDVNNHQPHPPGYPLFIAAAKVIALTGLDAFRCLQVVVLLGAVFLFPALYWLAREIGFEFRTAVAGAAVYAFLPNVWIYGGTGFSDVPATTIVFVACALLLRGRHDARALIAGAAVLGIAAGIRPANLIIGAVPALMATWSQIRAKSYRAVAAAMFLGAVIVGGSYLGAALASRGLDAFIDIVRAQSKYVREIDSWRNPIRPSLYQAAKRFLLWPFWHEDVLNGIAVAGALSTIAAIVRRRLAPLLTLAMFMPLALISWLNFDIEAAGRYSIAYLAAYSLLAADGFLLFGRKAQIVFCAAIVVILSIWTWPALQSQRTREAPPVAALRWVRSSVTPSATLFVHGLFGPLSDYVLDDRKPQFFEEPEDIPEAMGEAWVVDWRVHEGGQSFVSPHERLWRIIRRRNFEASVIRAEGLVRYIRGWHGPEAMRAHLWRWSKKEGTVLLPALRGSGIVSLRLFVPIAWLSSAPAVDIYWNGQVIDHFVATSENVERSWTLPSRAGAANELRLVTSATVIPARRGKSTDTRELGLRLDRLSWMPAQ
ncbi:MAG: hypothetical protein M3P06_14865 [Acidobacteriota bacterium]|nr:hypothetical protein [Acidobacteriota bacterium]